MKPLKAMAIAAFAAQLGFAYIAKTSAVSKGRPTNVEDQAIKMAKQNLERAFKG